MFALAAAAASPAAGQTCTVSATTFAFGNYQPLSGASSTSTATVTVNCTAAQISVLVSYSILLGPGGGGGVGARSMAGPSMRLNYQLYKDALYSQPWGDGTAGTTTLTDGYLLNVGLPISRPYTVYGRIPASSQVGTGIYTDTVTILLNF